MQFYCRIIITQNLYSHDRTQFRVVITTYFSRLSVSVFYHTRIIMIAQDIRDMKYDDHEISFGGKFTEWKMKANFFRNESFRINTLNK